MFTTYKLIPRLNCLNSATHTTQQVKSEINKLNRVYSAIEKRNIYNPIATYEEKFYLDHHRNTRHELYELIEKYLFA